MLASLQYVQSALRALSERFRFPSRAGDRNGRRRRVPSDQRSSADRPIENKSDNSENNPIKSDNSERLVYADGSIYCPIARAMSYLLAELSIRRPDDDPIKS